MDIGIVFRKPLPDDLLPPVGILLRGDQFQNNVAVYDLTVRSDAVYQLRPVFSHPPHDEQRVDPPTVSAGEIVFESRSMSLRKTVVESIITFRRRGGQSNGIDVKLLLFDDLPHQTGNSYRIVFDCLQVYP